MGVYDKKTLSCNSHSDKSSETLNGVVIHLI